MDIEDIIIAWAGIIGGFLMLILMMYGPYRYGRFVERRLLTTALTQSMNNTFWEGYYMRIQSEGQIETWEAQRNFQAGYRKAENDYCNEDMDGRR